MSGPHQPAPAEGSIHRFGEALRRRRELLGLSLAGLSAKVHYSRGHLSKIETGRAQPNRELAESCDRALDAGGELARLVQPRKPRRSRWTIAAVPVDLPATAGVFVGRSRDLARIVELLSDPSGTSRTVVVWGMPGVGKTELVVQVAEQLLDRYPDGCLYVDLHGVDLHGVDLHGADLHGAGRSGRGGAIDAYDAMARILQRLGLAAELIPGDREERQARYRHVMRDRRVLLVLDNPATAGDVLALVAPGGAGDVLVASRRRLGALDEAQQLQLRPLDQTHARRLFEELAGLRDSGATELRSVEAIATACAGLPLAVRVAAARFRLSRRLSVAEFGDLLQDERHRLGLLDDGERSIAATFDAACSALPPAQATLFALLAVHTDASFDLRLAGVVAGSPAPVVARLVDGLLHASLLLQTGRERYEFHDLLRSVALKRAAALAATELEAATVRVVAGCLAIAQQADMTVAPDRDRLPGVSAGRPGWPATFDSPATAAAWLDAHEAILVRVCEVAAERGDHDTCWRLAYALRDHFFRTHSTRAWIRTHLVALDSARATADPWAVAVTLNNLGLAYAVNGQLRLADERYVDALGIFRSLDDSFGEAKTLGHLAWTAHAAGDPAQAVAHATAALEFHRKAGHDRHVAITLRTLALAELARGNADSAATLLDESLDLAIGHRSILDETMALNCLGETAAFRGDADSALGFHLRAWSRARAVPSVTEEARALRGLAAVAAKLGRGAAARRLRVHAARRQGVSLDEGPAAGPDGDTTRDLLALGTAVRDSVRRPDQEHGVRTYADRRRTRGRLGADED